MRGSTERGDWSGGESCHPRPRSETEMSSTPSPVSQFPLEPDLAAAYVLPFDHRAPRLARRAAADVLGSWGFVRSHEVLLLVSELVANALFHGRGPIRLRLMSNRRVLLCAVIDSGRRLPRPRAPGPAGEHGRGLRLVHSLATAYGWRRIPAGKVVWFTYALVPAADGETERSGPAEAEEPPVSPSASAGGSLRAKARSIPTRPGHPRPLSPRPRGRRPRRTPGSDGRPGRSPDP